MCFGCFDLICRVDTVWLGNGFISLRKKVKNRSYTTVGELSGVGSILTWISKSRGRDKDFHVIYLFGEVILRNRKWNWGEWNRKAKKASICILLKFLLWAMELTLFCWNLLRNPETAFQNCAWKAFYSLAPIPNWSRVTPGSTDFLVLLSSACHQTVVAPGAKVWNVAVCLSNRTLTAWSGWKPLWNCPHWLWLKGREALRRYTGH